MRKLTKEEVKTIKAEMEKDCFIKLRIVQGNISELSRLASLIGENDYGIIDKNLAMLI